MNIYDNYVSILFFSDSLVMRVYNLVTEDVKSDLICMRSQFIYIYTFSTNVCDKLLVLPDIFYHLSGIIFCNLKLT